MGKEQAGFQTDRKAKLIQYSGDKKFFLDISIELETKIRDFCAVSPHREWSGVLFYTFTGNFKDGITIHADDMFLVDQGTAAHTEFDLDEPEITRYMFVEGLTDHCMGLIHSHNRMKAFFSGEDADTLLEYGLKMHNFVSLVVNNDGNYVARLTRQLSLSGETIRTTKGTIISPVFNTDNVDSQPFSKTTEEKLSDKWVEYIDLEVCKPVVNTTNYLARFGVVTSKDYNKPFERKSTILPPPPPPDWYSPRSTNPVYQQGALFDSTELRDDDVIDKELKDLARKVDWRALGFDKWFGQLVNGTPFDPFIPGIPYLNGRYQKRFPDEKDFIYWFDIWLDYMMADFESLDKIPDSLTKSYSSEELLLCHTYNQINAKGFIYEDAMIQTILTKMM